MGGEMGGVGGGPKKNPKINRWGGLLYGTGEYCLGVDTEVYSSTNWPPFTGGKNSILNWVLKLNPLNQKVKK